MLQIPRHKQDIPSPALPQLHSWFGFLCAHIWQSGSSEQVAAPVSLGSESAVPLKHYLNLIPPPYLTSLEPFETISLHISFPSPGSCHFSSFLLSLLAHSIIYKDAPWRTYNTVFHTLASSAPGPETFLSLCLGHPGIHLVPHRHIWIWTLSISQLNSHLNDLLPHRRSLRRSRAAAGPTHTILSQHAVQSSACLASCRGQKSDLTHETYPTISVHCIDRLHL
ncbi:hypothetical protein CONLIGDRAFT_204737 [Coniochaeta ligniaria NRRL 30616]|uniref:Uncharacterized protein n=1 Tax=Coniochaeta ligniaria NRRL 30616 TaxID=1408157 RepID=A0A1J7J1S3_9PEZI|nr:hypothetical protein CONLIGDRAFT_204737 [Coniochaeta ligniaria NRRL 30616]